MQVTSVCCLYAEQNKSLGPCSKNERIIYYPKSDQLAYVRPREHGAPVYESNYQHLDNVLGLTLSCGIFLLRPRGYLRVHLSISTAHTSASTACKTIGRASFRQSLPSAHAWLRSRFGVSASRPRAREVVDGHPVETAISVVLKKEKK